VTKGPSPHLSWAELGCKDGTPYPAEWRDRRAIPLAVEFERIRAVVGEPITVLSAYRTPVYNRKVGGARASQHPEGRALDLKPPKGWTVDRFYAVIREIAGDPRSAINGLGKYPTFIHIDIRPPRADGRITVWHGSRAWAELKAA
jgi:uncharacterized protein YcbK (DUF882 family)